MKKLIAAIAGLFAGRRRISLSEEVATRAVEDEKLASSFPPSAGEREIRAASGGFALPPGFVPTTIHFDELRIEPGNIIERRLASIEARLDRIESGEAHAELRRRRVV